MSSKRPNILLITSDQQHICTLGTNNPEIHTPNLDRLAAQGTQFDRAYCPNPTCTPTRASIITGLYPSQHGAWSLGTKLPEHVHTVGEDFQGAGYDVALIGKAHFQQLKGTEEYPSMESYPLLQDLAFWRDFHGPFYGFNHVELARNHADEAHVGQHYAIWMEEKGCENWREHFRKPTGTTNGQEHRWSIPEAFHYNTWIAERSVARMEQNAAEEKPFFLWASFFDPHPPYLVPEPWDTMYDPDTLTVPEVVPGEHDHNPPHFAETQKPRGEADFSEYAEPEGNSLHGMTSHVHTREKMARNIATYYGMVSCMDKYVGRILDRLDELGLSDNTLVVFTSDHGHFIGQHGLNAKGPFHYEDVINVPFIARWPGKVDADVHSDALLSLVDLAPTFLAACGLTIPRTMSGIDQFEVLCSNGEPTRDHILVENHHNPTTVHVKTYVDERYKLTVYYQHEYGELFDLQEDPKELHNRWNSPDHAALKAELLLKMLHAEFGKEPLWMPRVAGA